MTTLTLTEIAKQINEYLKRFEADPTINAQKYYTDRKGQRQPGTKSYYYAGAFRTGNRVSVCYVSYQSTDKLTRDEALEYLTALDGGFVGRHYAVLAKFRPSR